MSNSSTLRHGRAIIIGSVVAFVVCALLTSALTWFVALAAGWLEPQIAGIQARVGPAKSVEQHLDTIGLLACCAALIAFIGGCRANRSTVKGPEDREETIMVIAWIVALIVVVPLAWNRGFFEG